MKVARKIRKITMDNIPLSDKLSREDIISMCVKRELDFDWIEANCKSDDVIEASKKLGYQVSMPGVGFLGYNGQYQLRPNWKEDKFGPKYLTPSGSGYDVFVPNHPEDPSYWENLEELKSKCVEIDGKPYLNIEEGPIKSICLNSYGYPAVGVLGVEMGLTPGKKGYRELVRFLKILAAAGLNFLVTFDTDITKKKPVQKALIKLCKALSKTGALVRITKPWDISKGKGIDDLIQNEGIEAYDKLLKDTMTFEEYLEKTEEQDPVEYMVNNRTIESVVLKEFFLKNKDWVVIDDAFYQYTGFGSYQHIPDAMMNKIISDILIRAYKKVKKGEEELKKYEFSTMSKLTSSLGFCRAILTKKVENNNYLRAFADCTVDMRTGKKMPHDRRHYLINNIPQVYIQNAECPSIYREFLENVFGIELIPIVRAITSMLLDPTAPFGKFIHLIGPSGSGKGTQLRLWESMIGNNGVRSLSSFEDLSNADKRHQNLTGTQLIMFPDMGGYIKGLRAFYELVDNGPMSGRALFTSHSYQKQWNCHFSIASVEHLQIENSGDGWKRRCIPLPTKWRSQKEDPNLGKKLESVKGQIISWALAMDKEERDRLLMDPESWQDSLKEIQYQQAIYSDSIKSYIDLSLRPDDNPNSIMENADIYDTYVAFCHANGFQVMNRNKFLGRLKNVLPSNHVKRKRKMVNGSMITERSAYWFKLKPIPLAFVKEESNYGETQVICNKSKLIEGGLVEFQNFWKPKHSVPLSPELLENENEEQLDFQPPYQDNQNNQDSIIATQKNSSDSLLENNVHSRDQRDLEDNDRQVVLDQDNSTPTSIENENDPKEIVESNNYTSETKFRDVLLEEEENEEENDDEESNDDLLKFLLSINIKSFPCSISGLKDREIRFRIWDILIVMLACSTQEDLFEIRNCEKYTSSEVDWVWNNVCDQEHKKYIHSLCNNQDEEKQKPRGYESFPHLTSDDPRASRNMAEKIRNAIDDCTSQSELEDIISHYSKPCVDWVIENLLEDYQRENLQTLPEFGQRTLFDDENKTLDGNVQDNDENNLLDGNVGDDSNDGDNQDNQNIRLDE